MGWSPAIITALVKSIQKYIFKFQSISKFVLVSVKVALLDCEGEVFS